MENQQSPQPQPALDNFFNLVFDENTRTNIRTAAQWARIAAICNFVGYAIGLVVAFFGRPTQYTQYTQSDEGNRITAVTQTSSILGALIAVAIGVCINYFLYRFATRTVQGMDAMDSVKSNEGFNDLRLYFKICGIIAIVVLSLCVLGMFFGVIAGLSSLRS